MAWAPALPPASELPRRLVGFLDARLSTGDALRGVPSLAAELGAECDALERDVSCGARRLSSLAEAWAARSAQARSLLRQLGSDLGTTLMPRPCPSPDGSGEMGSSRTRRILATELPLLAKELGRIERVRLYAETTLHLEALIGDLEDAALFLISQNSRNGFLSHDSDPSSPIVRALHGSRKNYYWP